MQLARLSSPDVAARATTTVLAVPVGSTEQHGAHLPLGTDTDIALELCRRLGARRGDVLVAPAVAYGSSGEHAGFAGTLSIGREALELLLVELCRSASQTVDRIVLVSAHGGNAVPAARAAARLTAEGRDVLLWQPRWEGDAHAGRPETSMQLAIDPTRVRPELAEVGDTRALAELMPLLLAGGVRAVTDTGVLGDPTGANADEGRALLAQLSSDLVAAVDARWPATAGALR